MKRSELVDAAVEIAEEYAGDGFKLTLRQLYYQLVARGLSPNGQKYYTRLGNALGDARLGGACRVDIVEDRGRSVRSGYYTAFYHDVEEALATAADEVHELPLTHLHVHPWYGQRIHVSVWVEKDALAGVFEPVCNKLGVGWFPCKGYPSISSLLEYLNHLKDAQAAHPGPDGFDAAVVLYFGDHDPDGMEIPQSADRTLLRLINEARGAPHADEVPFIEFVRVALTKEQIDKYKPVPFPAKITSSRFPKYVRDTGLRDAWELDALDPKILQALINKEVSSRFDRSTYDAYKTVIDDARASMRMRMEDPEWIAGALAGD